MHVKTEFKINLCRFGQAICLNQAFLHSDTLPVTQLICVNVLFSHVYRVLLNVVIVHLTMEQSSDLMHLEQKFYVNMEFLLHKFERDKIYFQLKMLLEHCRRSELENIESQLPSGDNQSPPEG